MAGAPEVLPEPLRYSEICERDAAVGPRHEIAGLDIAMDDAAVVNLAQGASRLREQRQTLPPAQARDDDVGEAAAGKILHGDVSVALAEAAVVDLDHVRMAQSSHRFRLAQETLPLVRPGIGAGQQHLQGDGPVEAQVPRFVDDPRPAAPQHPLHFVERDPR